MQNHEPAVQLQASADDGGYRGVCGALKMSDLQPQNEKIITVGEDIVIDGVELPAGTRLLLRNVPMTPESEKVSRYRALAEAVAVFRARGMEGWEDETLEIMGRLWYSMNDQEKAEIEAQ